MLSFYFTFLFLNLQIIGLKQGCASLSNLSFVITKNRGDISFGIIALALQHDKGCYLPSFQLDSSRDAIENITEILENECPASVSACVTEYGLGSRKRGVTMIAKHIDDLNNPNGWGFHEHIFKLIITDSLNNNEKSGSLLSISNADDEDEDMDDDDNDNLASIVTNSIIKNRRLSQNRSGKNINIDSPFQNLLTQLEKDVPKYYIHIPDKVILSLCNKRVRFNYWQRHLIGLTRFDQQILEDEYVRDLKTEDLQKPSDFKVRIFCGFDPIRVDPSNVEQKALSLYIYSRQSGRLIKYTPDARNLLKLTASGTMYAQAMTCIVDDYQGKIPLNPTKQDVAFSEKQNGDILGENLYAWTSAIVNAYYKFHLETKFANKKGELTEEVRGYTETIAKKNKNDQYGRTLRGLGDDAADFTRLDGIIWGKLMGKVNGRWKAAEEIDGEDTLYQIVQPKVRTERGKSSSAKKKAKTPSSTKKRKITKRAKTKAKMNTSFLELSDGEIEDEGNEFMPNDDDDFDDFELTPQEILPSQAVTKAEGLEIQRLKNDLEMAKNLNEKQQHDLQKLHVIKEGLQATVENHNLHDQVNTPETQAPMPQLSSGDKDYKYVMLEEVKNNLQDENDRLQQEIDYIMGQFEEKEKKLRADMDYLTKKQAAMEKKLQAERQLRLSVEEELKALEDNMKVQRS
jgi:hypothetical protein